NFDTDDGGDYEDEDESGFLRGEGFIGREENKKDYDRDHKFAEILGSFLDDPDKAKSKMEERLRRKRN
ncbi:dna-directed rna polymerase i subunit rpa2, partial [Olea europaea subsp. europaea]